MDRKDILREAAVGGLGGLVVVVVFIVIRSRISGATDADWLSFAGAIAGTSLAVAGATWVEHWKRARERTGETKAILAAVIRLRSVAQMMLKDRPADISETEWQGLINQMPENLATYAKRLDRALDRVTTATTDFDVVEAGDMVLRAANRVQDCIASVDTAQAPNVVASLNLLVASCDVAVPMMQSRINPGRAMTFSEAIKNRGEKID
jgi:hypothetical protein